MAMNRQAYDAIAQIDTTIDAKTMAQRIIDEAARVVKQGLDMVVAKENKRPIYVVADIVHSDPFVPAQLVIVGGTAASLGPIIGDTTRIACSYSSLMRPWLMPSVLVWLTIRWRLRFTSIQNVVLW